MKNYILIVIFLIPFIAVAKETFWCQGGHKGPTGWEPLLHTEITPDNKYYISSGNDATIRIFDIATGNMVASLDNGQVYYSGLGSLDAECYWFTLSNNNKYLITDNGFVYSLPDGKLTRKIKDTTYPRIILPTNLSDSLIISIDSKKIKYINFFTDKVIKQFSYNSEHFSSSMSSYLTNHTITKITHNKDNIIIYNTDEGMFSILDISTGEVLKQKKVLNFSRSIDFDIGPHDKFIYAMKYLSFSNEVKVIDINELKVVKTINLPISKSEGLGISSDGKRLLTNVWVTKDNAIYQKCYSFDLNNPDNYQVLDEQEIGRYTFLSNSKLAVISEWEGAYAALVNYETMEVKRNIASHIHEITDVKFSPDDKYFATIEFLPDGPSSYKMQLFNINTRIRKFVRFMPMQHSYNNLTDPFISFTPDGQYFAVPSVSGDENSDGNSLWFCKIDNSFIREFRGHTKPITDAIFSKDGKKMITASFDSTLRIWDVNNGSEIEKIKFSNPLLKVKETYDGNSYIVLNYNEYGNSHELIKVNKSSHEKTILDYDIFPAGKAWFSKEARYFAYLNWDEIHIVDLVNDSLVNKIPFEYSRDVSFSRDNRFVLIVGDSAKSIVWDIQNNVLKKKNYYYPHKIRFNNYIGVEMPPTNMVSCFSNQRNLLAIGTDDASAIIYDYSNLTDVKYVNNKEYTGSKVRLQNKMIENNKLTLVFNIEHPTNANVRIFDFNGRLIKDYGEIFINSEIYEINLKKLNLIQGQYFCNVTIDNKIYNFNLILIN